MVILVHDVVMDAFQILVVPFADGRIDIFAVDAAVPVFAGIHPGLGKDAAIEILVDFILAVFGIITEQFTAFHIVVGQIGSQVILLAPLRRPTGNILAPGHAPVDDALFLVSFALSYVIIAKKNCICKRYCDTIESYKRNVSPSENGRCLGKTSSLPTWKENTRVT